jgi:hypothetical protein
VAGNFSGSRIITRIGGNYAVSEPWRYEACDVNDESNGRFGVTISWVGKYDRWRNDTLLYTLVGTS